MQIYGPLYWEDVVDYGVESLEIILGRFAVPLFAEPKVLWRQILSFKRLQFPNLCLVIELLITIAGSNSAIERVFCVLILLLNDRRLCMTHETMENLMIVKGNDKVWTEKEKKTSWHVLSTFILRRDGKQNYQQQELNESHPAKRYALTKAGNLKIKTLKIRINLRQTESPMTVTFLRRLKLLTFLK